MSIYIAVYMIQTDTDTYGPSFIGLTPQVKERNPPWQTGQQLSGGGGAGFSQGIWHCCIAQLTWPSWSQKETELLKIKSKAGKCMLQTFFFFSFLSHQASAHFTGILCWPPLSSIFIPDTKMGTTCQIHFRLFILFFQTLALITLIKEKGKLL